MMDISKVRSAKQISEVVELARVIWTDHYAPIIGQDQVDYMLGKFQSEKAIAAQLGDGYEYYTVSRGGRIVGYLAVVPDADTDMLMISKIYVLRSGRDHGFGRAMLEFAEDICRERRISTLCLTVNKNNRHSIAWYTRMGFKNVGSIVQDIGGGFLMDDYRMEKTIGQRSPAGDYGESPRIIPRKKFEEIGRPELLVELSPGHAEEWFMACRGEKPLDFPKSNFDYAGPFT